MSLEQWTYLWTRKMLATALTHLHFLILTIIIIAYNKRAGSLLSFLSIAGKCMSILPYTTAFPCTLHVDIWQKQKKKKNSFNCYKHANCFQLEAAPSDSLHSAAAGQKNISVIELLSTVLLGDIYFNKHKVVMLPWGHHRFSLGVILWLHVIHLSLYLWLNLSASAEQLLLKLEKTSREASLINRGL